VISPTSFTTTLVPLGNQQGYTQFKAIGYYGHAGHQRTADITSQVTWLSNAPQVATIVTGGANAGIATASGSWTGLTNITASAPGYNGDIVSNVATFTVTDATTDDVVSVSITPNPYTFLALNATNQFTATGTTQSGVKENLTTASGIVWTSNNTSFVTIVPNTGFATSVGAGSTTIQAVYTNADGSTATGMANVTVQ
jgi:hypothetical protein